MLRFVCSAEVNVLTLAVLVAHVAWVLPSEAQRPVDFGASSGPCAVYGKPAPAARIEGRVVARDGAPRPGIRVRAVLPDTDGQYMTVTDGEGRFTITGFDADVDVAFEFEAPSGRMGAHCPVFRVTRHAPEEKLLIVLDHVEPGLTAPEGDCPSVWEATGPVKFQSRDEERAIFGVREEPQAVRLDLRARDIVDVRWSRDGADVLLNEAASRELHAFSSANAGRLAVVTIDGMVAWRAWISGPSRDLPDRAETPATMWISENQLRGSLCRTLEEAAARSRRK